ncbi:MAG: cyclic nucleotide-binding domain-containing protein [Pseudomonadota bacterium]
MGLKEVMETLRKCELFGQLSDNELRIIAELGKVESYSPGEEIFQQGRIGTKLYILSEGRVSLYRKIHLGNTREGTATVYVAREQPHRRLLGGWCTLVGEEHIQMCTARCDRPAKLIAIPSQGLREVMIGDANIRVKILEKLVLLLRDRIESSYTAMETL